MHAGLLAVTPPRSIHCCDVSADMASACTCESIERGEISAGKLGRERTPPLPRKAARVLLMVR